MKRGKGDKKEGVNGKNNVIEPGNGRKNEVNGKERNGDGMKRETAIKKKGRTGEMNMIESGNGRKNEVNGEKKK